MARKRQGRRIPDKKRKEILATYVENNNYSATARKHGISPTTVKRIVMEDPNLLKVVDHKKKENTKAVLDAMDERTGQVLGIIDKLLIAIEDDKKIASTPLNQLATTMGIVIDKFTMRDRLGMAQKESESLNKLDKLLGDIDKAADDGKK